MAISARNTAAAMRVIIADDHPLYREAVRLRLERSFPGAEIAEAGRRLNHIAAETAMLEERWLELQSEIESLTAAATSPGG